MYNTNFPQEAKSIIAPQTIAAQYCSTNQQPQLVVLKAPITTPTTVTTASTTNQIPVPVLPITTTQAKYAANQLGNNTAQQVTYYQTANPVTSMPVMPVPVAPLGTQVNAIMDGSYQVQTPTTPPQVIIQRPTQQPTSPTNNNNNDLMQVKDGLCQMLSEQKIQSTMQKKKDRTQRVHFHEGRLLKSGLIEPFNDNYGGFIECFKPYFNTEKLIDEYKQALNGVYDEYIKKNPHNRTLNNEFMFFSKELTEKLFDVIKEYQKCYRFNVLKSTRQLNTPEYRNLFWENDEKDHLVGGQLEKNCNNAINSARNSLKAKLQSFNDRAQKLIHDSADHLFGSNNQGDSVDDMAADDCVFNQSNIRSLFPGSGAWGNLDNDAKEAFLKKLSIEDEDPNANTQFICDISTFTDALLAAAESTFGEYLDPEESQRRYVEKFIKHATDVATEGWKKYQILFKHMNNEQKEIVQGKYRTIFTNIQHCKDKYNAYLQDKLRYEENKSEKNKINNLIDKYNKNVKKITPPKGIGMINNGVSTVGLNYKNPIFEKNF